VPRAEGPALRRLPRAARVAVRPGRQGTPALGRREAEPVHRPGGIPDVRLARRGILPPPARPRAARGPPKGSMRESSTKTRGADAKYGAGEEYRRETANHTNRHESRRLRKNNMPWPGQRGILHSCRFVGFVVLFFF